jgi:hypothetical protein
MDAETARKINDYRMLYLQNKNKEHPPCSVSPCHPQDVTWDGINGYQCLNCGAKSKHAFEIAHKR